MTEDERRKQRIDIKEEYFCDRKGTRVVDVLSTPLSNLFDVLTLMSTTRAQVWALLDRRYKDAPHIRVTI